MKLCNSLLDRHPGTDSLPPTQGALDSAATVHCFPDTVTGVDSKDFTLGSALAVECANGDVMFSSGTAQLDLPQLPSAARTFHKFPQMTTPLISVRKLCAADLAVQFQGDQVSVFKPNQQTLTVDGQQILSGHIDPKTDLYMVDLQNHLLTYKITYHAP